jgi:predicted ATP-grasp superfamily ATP-dependent carboligase
VTDDNELQAIRAAISFPAMVKPVQSHKFTKVFGRKLFIVENSFEELEGHLRTCWAHGLDVFVVEMIPGPDSLLSSYYTYRTKTGQRLFDFTKSVIRRWPVNRGNACHHKTDWLPETAEAGRKFFDAAGLRGLGNIEFKRDLRDGKLKVIEVNARFTAAQELVRRAGVPIDLIIYCHLTKQHAPAAKQDERELRLWYPVRDFLGFLELRRRGELSLVGWLKSILKPGTVFPLASLTDPLPMLGASIALAHKLMA